MLLKFHTNPSCTFSQLLLDMAGKGRTQQEGHGIIIMNSNPNQHEWVFLPNKSGRVYIHKKTITMRRTWVSSLHLSYSIYYISIMYLSTWRATHFSIKMTSYSAMSKSHTVLSYCDIIKEYYKFPHLALTAMSQLRSHAGCMWQYGRMIIKR